MSLTSLGLWLAALILGGVVLIELDIWVRRGLRALFSSPDRDTEQATVQLTEFLDCVDDVLSEDHAQVVELEEENHRLRQELSESLLGGEP